MYQRNLGPTAGALRRTLISDAAATPRCSSRAFSVSARRVEESKGAAPSAPVSAGPSTRKTRTANALSQITRLGANRRTAGIQSGGLAKADGLPGQGVGPAGSLKITREPSGPEGPRRGGPPPGAMARAPAQLKLSRNNGPRRGANSSVGDSRGPNLRGREGGKAPGGRVAGNRTSGGPARRKTEDGDESAPDPSTTRFEDSLSDGMLQHLLRVQRGQWDRKPYEPKYAPGSFAANQLIHQGREFFRGEAPPVKIWGRLEKAIGVVGMHNAEAHLKVRRVTNMDDESWGERREYFETGNIEIQVKAKAPTATKAPAKASATNAPAAVAQAAAAKVPAPEQAPLV